MGKEIIVSGIRPTGNLHLGNYLGAVSNFVKMQHEHHCFFFIADYHSLTTHPNPADLHQNVRQVLVEYLACGLDPEACTLYIQSDLPQIPELYMLLNMHAYMGELERVASFKEKARTQPNNINAGLLTYPVLMAADIIIHKATKVPVGKDQEQHLEMARTFGNRFNRMYQQEIFPEPYAFNYGKELIENNKNLIKLNNPTQTTRILMANDDKAIIMPDKDEQYGRNLYNKYQELRDLSVVMEHPEFFSFYLKYMRNPNNLKQMLVLMKLYHLISQYMHEKDPNGECHNSYHKLVFIYKILANPIYSRLFIKKILPSNLQLNSNE